MNFTLKHTISKVSNVIIGGFVSGFCIGFCFPNTLHVNFKSKRYINNNFFPIPLISGLICSTGIILSPLLITNYFCNGTYFDRLIDKYNINVERYHQYDGKNNKYAYPSLIIINIQSKV